jgi:hypothetical protein
MTAIAHIGVIERREYLIDHFHVSFEGGAAWHCACHQFTLAGSCRHTREAIGMRDAQALIRRQMRAGRSVQRGRSRAASRAADFLPWENP